MTQYYTRGDFDVRVNDIVSAIWIDDTAGASGAVFRVWGTVTDLQFGSRPMLQRCELDIGKHEPLEDDAIQMEVKSVTVNVADWCEPQDEVPAVISVPLCRVWLAGAQQRYHHQRAQRFSNYMGMRVCQADVDHGCLMLGTVVGVQLMSRGPAWVVDVAEAWPMKSNGNGVTLRRSLQQPRRDLAHNLVAPRWVGPAWRPPLAVRSVEQHLVFALVGTRTMTALPKARSYWEALRSLRAVHTYRRATITRVKQQEHTPFWYAFAEEDTRSVKQRSFYISQTSEVELITNIFDTSVIGAEFLQYTAPMSPQAEIPQVGDVVYIVKFTGGASGEEPRARFALAKRYLGLDAFLTFLQRPRLSRNKQDRAKRDLVAAASDADGELTVFSHLLRGLFEGVGYDAPEVTHFRLYCQCLRP
jgi:hypothetical protein